MPLCPARIVKAVFECYFQWYFEEIGAEQWAALAVLLLFLLAKRCKEENGTRELMLSTVPFSSKKYRFHR